MTYGISKAITIINKEIEKRATGDESYNFSDSFAEDSSTGCFVRQCVSYNQLNRVLVDKWSNEQQYNYLHNILRFWYGMPYDEIDEYLHTSDVRVPVAQLFSVTAKGYTEYFCNHELDRTEIIEQAFTASNRISVLRSLGELMTKEEYDRIMNSSSWTRALEFDFDKQTMNDVEVIMYEDKEPQKSATPHRFENIPANYDAMYYSRIYPPELDGESVIMPDDLEGEWRIVDTRFLLSAKPLYLIESLNYGLCDHVRYALVDDNQNVIAENIRSIDQFIGENYERAIRISSAVANGMIKAGYNVLDPSGKCITDKSICVKQDYLCMAKPSAIFKYLGLSPRVRYNGHFGKERPKKPIVFTVVDFVQGNSSNTFVLPGIISSLDQLKEKGIIDQFLELTGDHKSLVQAYCEVLSWGLGYCTAAEPTPEQLVFITENLQDIEWEQDVYVCLEPYFDFTPNAVINDNSEHITIDGYDDTFYGINSAISDFERVFLLESETQGEDVPHIVVNAHGEVRSHNMYSLLDYQQAIDNLEIEIER